jgi:hypothetical protein
MTWSCLESRSRESMLAKPNKRAQRYSTINIVKPKRKDNTVEMFSVPSALNRTIHEQQTRHHPPWETFYRQRPIATGRKGLHGRSQIEKSASALEVGGD